MLQWDLCIKSLQYEKDCGWVLRPKTKHAGRIPTDAWEKSRKVTQVVGGMSRAAQSSMDSDRQSIWLARKQDVFNPGCCWLQCCWFHQICIMLSNQDEFCTVQAWNPSLDLLQMELYVQKSLSSTFSLCRFLTVRTWVKPSPSSALSNLGGSCSELAYRHSGWFLTVSATSFGCNLFEENRRKCALILAGGQPASGRRSEGCWYGGCCRLLAGDLRGERQVFFSNRNLSECLTLISP